MSGELTWKSNYNGPDNECPEWLANGVKGKPLGMLAYEPVYQVGGLIDQWVWYQEQAERLTGPQLKEVIKKRDELIKNGWGS